LDQNRDLNSNNMCHQLQVLAIMN